MVFQHGHTMCVPTSNDKIPASPRPHPFAGVGVRILAVLTDVRWFEFAIL